MDIDYKRLKKCMENKKMTQKNVSDCLSGDEWIRYCMYNSFYGYKYIMPKDYNEIKKKIDK